MDRDTGGSPVQIELDDPDQKPAPEPVPNKLTVATDELAQELAPSTSTLLSDDAALEPAADDLQSVLYAAPERETSTPSGSRPPQGEQGERRGKRRLDAATGISLREPYAADNVIEVTSNTMLPFRWKGLRWPKPRNVGANARNDAWEYGYYWKLTEHTYEFTEEQSPLLGNAIARRLLQKKNFHRPDLEKIRNLRDAKNTTYLIIRGLSMLRMVDALPYTFPLDEEFPEKHRDTEYLIGRRYGVETDGQKYRVGSEARLKAKTDRMNERFKADDFIVCGLARLLNCAVLPRYKEHQLGRNMLTDPSEQQSSDLDNIDMALRFQQSTVEKKLPKPHETLSYGDIGCLYRVYLCVKNVLRIPIYLIPVKEIIETHLCPHYTPERKAEIINILKSGQFDRIGPRSPIDEEFGDVGSSPILRDMGNGDWIMSFDHERVKAHGRQTNEERAIFELREAIRRARRDAIRVELKPREILIVDNFRVMISRREFLPTSFGRALQLLLSVATWSKGALRHWRPKFRQKLPDENPDRDRKNKDEVVRAWPVRPHRWLRTYYLFRAKFDDNLLERHL